MRIGCTRMRFGSTCMRLGNTCITIRSWLSMRIVIAVTHGLATWGPGCGWKIQVWAERKRTTAPSTQHPLEPRALPTTWHPSSLVLPRTTVRPTVLLPSALPTRAPAMGQSAPKVAHEKPPRNERDRLCDCDCIGERTSSSVSTF